MINIFCKECENKGKKPHFLGRVSDDTEGALYFYCRSCRKEIKVVISGGKYTAEYSDQPKVKIKEL